MARKKSDSYNNLRQEIHHLERPHFVSAECTIGMVWGLTALKHYGNTMAIRHVQNVLAKSCLPCQILYKPKKFFAERGKA